MQASEIEVSLDAMVAVLLVIALARAALTFALLHPAPPAAPFPTRKVMS